MSVYTVVARSELAVFLRRYAVGTLHSFRGVDQGIENTNYFVSTSAGEFVLTLFEATPAVDLPFFLDVMAFLADRGIPSAHPVADRHGRYLQQLNERPTALVQRIDGAGVECPKLPQCHEIGLAMGRMHVLTGDCSLTRVNDRDAAWRLETAATVRSRLAPDDQELLDEELSFQRDGGLEHLPKGVIHADLFRDNALFIGDKLNGIIDFYYAHTGAFIYDLAVTISDWCYDEDGRFDPGLARAIIDPYRRERPVTGPEIEAWVPALRAAGLRFWLSRLRDLHYPRAGAITHIKDPGAFKRVLSDCRERPASLMTVWEG